MAEIVVPGEELAAASEALTRTLAFIDSERIPGDIKAILGGGALSEAAGRFDSDWDDGRFQLKKQGKAINEAIEKIQRAFGDTDTNTANSLQRG
ncbi:hypothetical protein [Asanoa siamensis]|uniref:WXG100 family type VII secretion target n=1 Tax=Asanoa siamensis TaxID=926357 RepID=A0ABQ4D2G6_9ACTN|nr:hypothetical protein [Asanoa siamensis]GIF77730.1 hypothetical protein Asi02nite_72480 [Asanoa siamensis]